MLTSDQVVSEIVARELVPRKGPDGWLVYRGDARVRVPAAATLEAAIEAAALELDRRAGIEAERSARRIIAAQQRGDHFHRPRRVQQTVDGETVVVVVFDIIRVADATPVVTGSTSVVGAWLQLAVAIAATRGEPVQ